MRKTTMVLTQPVRSHTGGPCAAGNASSVTRPRWRTLGPPTRARTWPARPRQSRSVMSLAPPRPRISPSRRAYQGRRTTMARVPGHAAAAAARLRIDAAANPHKTCATSEASSALDGRGRAVGAAFVRAAFVRVASALCAESREVRGPLPHLAAATQRASSAERDAQLPHSAWHGAI